MPSSKAVFLVPRSRIVTAATIATLLGPGAGAAAAANAEVATGKTLFLARCAECHGTSGANGQGPGLGGVLGRKAASQKGFAYSAALRSSGLVWDTPTLDRYLTLPAKLVPGTRMALTVKKPEERQSLIAYLSTLTGSAASATESKAERLGAASTGAAALGDYRVDHPGVRRRLTVKDLPEPFATRSARNGPSVVRKPTRARLLVPEGFGVDLFAEGLVEPRLLRVAPNGDVFVAESAAGQIRVLRANENQARPEIHPVFAKDLNQPFGIAFYPPGPDPQFVYVAETNSVVRFPYERGDLRARGPRETIVASLTADEGGHWTRDVAFSPDGARMFVSVGSASNVGEGIGRRAPEEIVNWESKHGLGAPWGYEDGRACVRVFDPQGKNTRTFATGIRNCVGLAISPVGDLWCSTNERDGLGDDLVPDYVTRVREGAFYGWPWYYIGDHVDPRHAGERPDLKGKVTVPDVLEQPHSASLQIAFYDGAMFPADYRGDAFVAFHGSWNRSQRTGYKVVRIRLNQGQPTGEYEDFLTGFVVDDDAVWGRPVGVAVAKDGALLVSEDGNGTVWRIAVTR